MAHKDKKKTEHHAKPHKPAHPRHSSTKFDAPPPEATNYDHPAEAGTRGTMPGGGLVTPGADVNPDELSARRPPKGAPGAGPRNAPESAPGATRPEALNPPDESDIPRPISDELPGIADPNFPEDKDRPEDRDM